MGTIAFLKKGYFSIFVWLPGYLFLLLQIYKSEYQLVQILLSPARLKIVVNQSIINFYVSTQKR